VIQTQALQDRNVPDKQQWELAAKFMENVIKKELEHQEFELISSTTQNSWWKFLGFQPATIEQKYRQQCVKELDRLLISRQQFDRTTKNNYVVSVVSKNISFRHILFSFVLCLIMMN
jgi:optic atrophy protein 1